MLTGEDNPEHAALRGATTRPSPHGQDIYHPSVLLPRRPSARVFPSKHLGSPTTGLIVTPRGRNRKRNQAERAEVGPKYASYLQGTTTQHLRLLPLPNVSCATRRARRGRGSK